MMPHIPSFPPNIDDWLPGDPTKLQPPLPRFSWNPSWLTSEQFTQLEEETSTWAAKRAQSMVGPRYGFEAVRRAAHSMLDSYVSRLPALPIELTKAPAERRRRERKPREEMGRELAPLVGVLTPAQEEELTSTALEYIITAKEETKRSMTTKEKSELAKTVVTWAELDRIKITEAKGSEIVKKALARFAPVRS